MSTQAQNYFGDKRVAFIGAGYSSYREGCEAILSGKQERL
jgi:hypothetical protein